MRHTHYTRITISTGLVERLPFVEDDGHRFNAGRLDGYTENMALLIVNRWNYLASMQSVHPRFLYYLNSAEGAK